MSSNRSLRFVQNTLSTVVYQLTAMVMGFVTPRLMMLYYGSEVNGLIVSVTDFLTYFKMVEAGLAAAAYAALYKPLADQDDLAISRIVSAARRFYNVAGWCFMGLTIVFSFLYPLFVPVHEADGGLMSYLSTVCLILAMGVSGALEFFTMSRYRVLLTADQKTYVVSLASMVSLMLSTALIVLLPYIGMDVIIVRLAASLTILARAFLLRRYTAKHYPRIDPMATPDEKALSGRWDALYVELTSVLQQGAGVILATLIIRKAGILSVYGVYHMVTVGLWGVLKMMTTGIYSIFGNLRVSGAKSAFTRAFSDFECLYLMGVSILFGAAAVLIVPFVNLYTHGVTDVNYNVPALGLLLIAEALTNHCKMPLDLMINASGRFRDCRKHCVAQILVMAIAGGVLGLLGLRVSEETAICGIVIGVILGNLTRTGCQLSLIPAKVTGQPWQISLKRMLLMFLNAALIAVPLLIWGPVPHRFFTWVMYAAMLVLYGGVMTFILWRVFEGDSVQNLWRRAKGLLRRGGGVAE